MNIIINILTKSPSLKNSCKKYAKHPTVTERQIKKHVRSIYAVIIQICKTKGIDTLYMIRFAMSHYYTIISMQLWYSPVRQQYFIHKNTDSSLCKNK